MAILLVQNIICQGLLRKPVVATGKASVITHTEALLNVELIWRSRRVERVFTSSRFTLNLEE